MGQHTVRVVARPARAVSRITPRTGASVVIAVYVVLIAGAEVLSALGWIVLGVSLDLAIVVLLLNHYALLGSARYRRVLPVFVLLPLLRALSWTMTTWAWPHTAWYALVGAPVLMAVFLTAQFLRLPTTRLGLSLPSWREQLLIGMSGFPVGLGAFLVLRPQPLAIDLGPTHVVIGILVLSGFVGFTEELLFRGLLQKVAVQTVGRAGLLVSSSLFVVVYIGSLSIPYLILMAVVGMFFGWCVERTGSIWGVVLAHSIWVVEALLILPVLWP